MHTVNIEKIQTETIKILKETQKLLPKTQELEGNYKDVLHNEKNKLKNLEYVIAVVGTVKAGKSTTINAIVGREILPHRTEAMTTLPTLITHVLEQEEPVLKLSKLEPLKLLLKNIKKKITKKDKSDFLKTDEGLEFQKIMLDKEFSFFNSYNGEQRIFEFLKNFNDMMRAAKELEIEPPFKEFENVDQLPRIEVAFKYLKNHDSIANAKLSLLDTPGPNEFKHSEHLKRISESQLKKASSVMLIINYPQISSRGSGEIREEFSKTVHFVGKEHMFVLANQLDNVSSNDAEPEKIKKNIAENKLNKEIERDNVFPISAKDAFYAQLGLEEIEKNNSINEELPWRIDFGKTILGDLWETDIDDLERLKKICELKWRNSLFVRPLNIIIADAHTKASFKSIDGALNKLMHIAIELKNSFMVQEESLFKSIEKLKQDIELLQQDIERMKNISEKIKKYSNVNLINIKKDLDNIIKQELLNASKKMMTIFDEHEAIEIKKQEIDIKKQEFEQKQNNPLYFFQNSIASLIGTKQKTMQEQIDELQKTGELKFDSEDKAKEFKKFIIDSAKEYTINVFKITQAKFQEKSKEFISSLNVTIEEQLGELLEEIKKRLGKEIQIEVPEIIFENNGVKIGKSFEGLIETYEAKKSVKVEQDGFWGSIKRGLDFFDNEWGYDRQTVYEDKPLITKSKIQDKLQSLFDDVSSIVEENADGIFERNIQKAISEAITILIQEVENYRKEMISTAKKREADEIDMKEEIESAKNLQSIADILQQRIQSTTKILSKLHNG